VSRWKIAFNRIGGPDAVTWPAFWITYASSLIAHLTTGGTVNASLGVRVVVVTVAQVASFIPLLFLRWTILRRPSRPLPWVAVAGFAVAAVVRGIVLSGSLVLIGAVTQPLWAYRIIASLQNYMLLLIIVALVVSSMRAHTRSLETLIGVQSQLIENEIHIVEDVTTRNEQALAHVQERLRDELSSLDSVRGADSVRELQRLASDVVRPMSHELATSVPLKAMTTPPIDSAHVSWRQAAMEMVDQPPLRPLLAAAYMVLILTSSALGVFGAARGLPMAGVVFLCVLVGSWVANRLLGHILGRIGPRTGLLAVFLSSVIVGFASATVAGYFLPPQQNYTIFIFGGALFITGVLVLTAVVTTILRRQRATERDLADSTERLERQLVRLRQAQWLQRQELARALHGPVQAAVTAAALRLDAAVRAGNADTALLDQTRKRLLAVVDVLDTSEVADISLDVALSRIRATWDGLCEITSLVEDDAAVRIANDSLAAAVVMDLMSEAVSNAVRHGEAEHAVITITLDDQNLITLVVADDGMRQQATLTRGLGSSLLDGCTLDWTRDVTAEGSRLITVVPTSATP
jgi:signal transduction histidine kinase